MVLHLRGPFCRSGGRRLSDSPLLTIGKGPSGCSSKEPTRRMLPFSLCLFKRYKHTRFNCRRNKYTPTNKQAAPPDVNNPYLQDVLPLGVLLAAQPPLFEEAAQFEAEQQQGLFQVLWLLHQQSPLLTPQLLLQPSLEAQALHLEIPP